jgi:hypothetical protein
MKTFYERTYPLMHAALQIARDNGHTFTKATRAAPDPPHKIEEGPKWCVTCSGCQTSVRAGLGRAQIIIGGVPLLPTCEQAQRYMAKYSEEQKLPFDE